MAKNYNTDIFFLSELIGRKVIINNKKIGRLNDMVIIETKKVPEVTHFIVRRSFGYPSLLVPFEKIKSIKPDKIELAIKTISKYEKEPKETQILLKDYILDKKVVDLDGNEVEVVYDVTLEAQNNKLYVSGVDFSKYGLLRRLKLKWLADLIYNLADRMKSEILSWTYIQPLAADISSFKGNVRLNVLKEKLTDIHPVDLADILEELDHNQRLAVFNELDNEQATATLEEIEPRVQRELIGSIKIEKAAELLNDMTPAQAADILAILPTTDADQILQLINAEDREKISFILDNQEEKITNFATSSFFKFLPTIKVKDVIDQFRAFAKEKDVIRYLYIVDENDQLVGVVDIKELLTAELYEKLSDIMTGNIIKLTPENTLIDAAKMFSRYSFRALPIVDKDKTILGVIPYRDIMNLTHHFID